MEPGAPDGCAPPQQSWAALDIRQRCMVISKNAHIENVGITGFSLYIENVNLRAYQWGFFISTILSGSYTVILSFLMFHLLAAGQLDARFSAYAGTSDYILHTH
jgi:hypothetical protein